MTVSATALPAIVSLPKGADVFRVDYDIDCVTVHVACMATGKKHVVQFWGPEGYRVLDERDLAEFWPTCSTPNGWLFEVQSGGWLEQEFERPGSMIAHLNRGLREFFVAGMNSCVSVLSVNAPEVLHVAEE